MRYAETIFEKMGADARKRAYWEEKQRLVFSLMQAVASGSSISGVLEWRRAGIPPERGRLLRSLMPLPHRSASVAVDTPRGRIVWSISTLWWGTWPIGSGTRLLVECHLVGAEENARMLATTRFGYYGTAVRANWSEVLFDALDPLAILAAAHFPHLKQRLGLPENMPVLTGETAPLALPIAVGNLTAADERFLGEAAAELGRLSERCAADPDVSSSYATLRSLADVCARRARARSPGQHVIRGLIDHHLPKLLEIGRVYGDLLEVPASPALERQMAPIRARIPLLAGQCEQIVSAYLLHAVERLDLETKVLGTIMEAESPVVAGV